MARDSEQMSTLLLTLRHNINLESDIALAQAEVAALCGLPVDSIKRIASAKELIRWTDKLDGLEARFLSRSLRTSGAVGFFITRAECSHFKTIIEQSAFAQEALLIGCEAIEASPLLQHLSRARKVAEDGYNLRGVPVATMLEYSAALVFRREKVGNIAAALEVLAEFLLDETQPPNGL